MLHIIYRSYGGENVKGRPEYYSKLLALQSFIRAFLQLPAGSAEIVFLNDGPIPQDRLSIMLEYGEIVSRSQMGLQGSVINALAIPAERQWPATDLVWLSEDDYLYLPGSLQDLIAAANAYPEASYFGLYALIGSREPNGNIVAGRIPSEWMSSAPMCVRGHPWRTALATTGTYGARAGALNEDRAMLRYALRSGADWDLTMCLMYHGYIPYPIRLLIRSFQTTRANKMRRHRLAVLCGRLLLDLYQVVRMWSGAKRRTLVAADPAVIAHLETAFLPQGTDWARVAEETQEWARSGLTQADHVSLARALGASKTPLRA